MYRGTRASSWPTPKPVTNRKTKSCGKLTDPATTAVPITDTTPAAKSAFRLPIQSAVQPWITAPNAAPAQKRELIAPRTDAVSLLLAGR